jgi:hypothetical protein
MFLEIGRLLCLRLDVEAVAVDPSRASGDLVGLEAICRRDVELQREVDAAISQAAGFGTGRTAARVRR